MSSTHNVVRFDSDLNWRYSPRAARPIAHVSMTATRDVGAAVT